MKKILFAILLCVWALSGESQTIYNGVPRYDDRDSIVNAHGVGVIYKPTTAAMPLCVYWIKKV